MKYVQDVHQSVGDNSVSEDSETGDTLPYNILYQDM